jgi:glutathione S-transferase
MITVHHLEQSRSHRIVWALEELGVEYDIKVYKREKTLLAPPELRAVHPLGKSPVITDGDLTLAESGAILDYLVERHGGGRLIPAPGSDERRRYTYWMHYAEGSLMPFLVLKLVARRIQSAPVPFFLRPMVKSIGGRLQVQYVDLEIARHVEYLEGELGQRSWFAGPDFTAADIQMSYPIESAISRAGVDSTRPNLWRFVEAIRARPAYQRAAERGGPSQLGV